MRPRGFLINKAFFAKDDWFIPGKERTGPGLGGTGGQGDEGYGARDKEGGKGGKEG